MWQRHLLSSEFVVEFCAAFSVWAGWPLRAWALGEFADFRHGPMEAPVTATTLPLIELVQEQGGGDFLGSVAEAALRLLRAPAAPRAGWAPAAPSAATGGGAGATAIGTAS